VGRRVLKPRVTSAWRFCSAARGDSPAIAATVHITAPLTAQKSIALPCKKSSACGDNLLEQISRKALESGRPVRRQHPVLLLLWLLYEFPTFRSQRTATWGPLETSPGWPSCTKLLLHTDLNEVQLWLPALPDFRTHTGGSRMRVQEKLPLQQQNSAAIGQHAEGGRRALGLELRGAVSPTCFQASAGFSAL